LTDVARARVVDLVVQDPHVAEVLARWGIVFCPGCFVALTSTVEQNGHYNAVKSLPDFLREVAGALESHQGPTADGFLP
jgi:iron-sulfur cluster repair protein YtfE (RIC family)